MISPIKLSLPCITMDNKQHLELNDNISFEFSLLGLEMRLRDKKLTIQLPLDDARNVIESLKIFVDSTYDQEDEYEYESSEGEEGAKQPSDEEYFPREKTGRHKL